jgi:hypothetical protein
MWRPWQTHSGRHKRIFSRDEEAALATFVRDNCIAKGLILTDSDFCEIAMNAFSLKYQDFRVHMPMLKCSPWFIANFKRRHCFTSSRVHFKHRSPAAQNQRQTCLAKIRELLQNVPWNRIIECGETSWLLHPNGILTWGEVGAESVQTKIPGNEKETITIVASVTAPGANPHCNSWRPIRRSALRVPKLDQ